MTLVYYLACSGTPIANLSGGNGRAVNSTRGSSCTKCAKNLRAKNQPPKSNVHVVDVDGWGRSEATYVYM